MGARKDQAQAYFFHVGRLIAGVMHGEPDAVQRPNRRPSMGTAIGLLLAVLVAAGFGIYGLLRPGGSNAWRNQTGSVILVKETGARYLYLYGQLRPVLNYTSARLVLRNGAPITSVSRDSLAGVPVGAPIGIPGAPDGLPSVNHLYRGSWTICARPPDTLPGSHTRTTLMLDDGQTPPMADGDGLLVSTPDNAVYLTWQGKRYRLASAAVAVALGYGARQPLPVTPAWLNPIPAGRDLAFPEVARRGSTGPVLGGRPGVVGRVYELRNPALPTTELYLLRGDGLVLLSRTMAALVLADPATRAAYEGMAVGPVGMTPDEVSAIGVKDRTTMVTGYPPSPPRAVNDTGAELPCVRHRLVPDGSVVTITLVPPESVGSAMSLAGPAVTGATADEVVMPAGAGMLVRNRVTPGTVYLVNESGVKFPLANDEAVADLGYQGVAPVEVASELLALLPTGPVLSQTAALATHPLGS